MEKDQRNLQLLYEFYQIEVKPRTFTSECGVSLGRQSDQSTFFGDFDDFSDSAEIGTVLLDRYRGNQIVDEP